MDKFHQCLHGYSNKKGHHKIAGSISLSRQSEQIMLSMSDRSGSFYNDFTEYITLYSLDSENEYRYALAKTWKAPEIRRPGCVWTHTILFTQNLKDIIQDLYPLVSYFRYPSKEGKVDVSFYEKELDDPSQKINKKPDSSDANKSKKQLIQACLNDNNQEKPIVVLAKKAKDYEKLIFEIWSSQKDLTFCTGALSIREINKRPLRLQVVPKKINYRSDMYFINEHNQVIPDKNHITEKVKLFQFIDTLNNDDTVIDQIIQLIKKIDTSNRIFSELFEAAVDYIKLNKPFYLQEIELFRTYIKYQSDFNDSVLNLSERTRQLYKTNPKKAVKLYYDNRKNSHTIPQKICNGIARAIDLKYETNTMSELADFLTNFAEKSADPEDIYKVIQFFIAWQKNEQDISSAIKLLKKYYPDRNEKVLLKQAFLGKKRKYLKKIRRYNFLSAFAEYPNLHESFDEKDLFVRERVKILWNKAASELKTKFVKVLLKNRTNEFAKIMFSEIVKLIDIDTSIYLISNQDPELNIDCKKHLLKEISSNRNKSFYEPIWEKVRHEDTELYQFLIEEFKSQPETEVQAHLEQPDDTSKLSITQMITSGYDINELIGKYEKKKILNEIKRFDIGFASRKFGEIVGLIEFDIIDFLNHIEFSIEAGPCISDIKWAEIARTIRDGNSEKKNELMLYFLSIGFENSYNLLMNMAFKPVCEALSDTKFINNDWNNFKKRYLNVEYFKKKLGKELKGCEKSNFRDIDCLYHQLFKLYSEKNLNEQYLDTKVVNNDDFLTYFYRFKYWQNFFPKIYDFLKRIKRKRKI